MVVFMFKIYKFNVPLKLFDSFISELELKEEFVCFANVCGNNSVLCGANGCVKNAMPCGVHIL